MTEIFNRKPQKRLRRYLRKLPIQAENRLWNKIRNKQLGYKFRRQYGIGNYIVDFYCPVLRLVIEIDGATHSTPEEIKKDKIRQNYFMKLGLNIKRYTNNDIRKSLEEVLSNIIETCKELDKKGN